MSAPSVERQAPAAATAVRRRDLAVLAAVTVVLRIPAFIADRHLTFDDGVYGASAVAMRAGGLPFRDVFSSQGPLFLPVIWLGDLLGLRTFNAPRLVSVLAGVTLVLATYLIGMTFTDRRNALLAAGLTTACASTLWVTGPIASDGVGLAFATVGIALAFRWQGRIDGSRAVAVGLAVGAAISVKSLIIGAVVPVAVVLLAQRRLKPIVVSALTAVVVHFALWVPFGIGDVWEQSYGYHLEVAGERTPLANLGKLLSTLGDRDLPVVAAVVLAMGATLLARLRRATGEPGESSDAGESGDSGEIGEIGEIGESSRSTLDTALLAWLGATVAVLLLEHPMWRPHVSQLVPVLALLAARHRAPWRALAAAAVLVVPYHLVHAWDILWPDGYPANQAAMVEAMAALPEGAQAMSDEPGLVWRAGRRTPDNLVDASILRIEAGQITSASLASAAARPEVCAVAVTSRVRWGSFDDLPDRLADAGYELAYRDGPVRRLYIKSTCTPPP